MTKVDSGFVSFSDRNFRLRRGRIVPSLLDGVADMPPGEHGLAEIDLEVKAGEIAGIAPAGTFSEEEATDLEFGLIWPTFVDAHTHLDKGHTWPRTPNLDGTFQSALRLTAEDQAANWTYEDVFRRFEFGLKCSLAHGTSAIRTHIDSYTRAQAEISWQVFRDLRDQWSGQIEVQATSLVPIEEYGTEYGVFLADLVAESGGNLGAYTHVGGEDRDEFETRFQNDVDRMFATAEERGLDIDVHVDETDDPSAVGLGFFARTARRRGFKGKLLCSHCCSLAVQPDELVEDTLDACADAGIEFISLPMANLYLMDRQLGRTPRWRGLTVVQEMKSQGIPVSVASDNCRDPWHGFGDHDMFEVFTQAVKIGHLDTPAVDWAEAVTHTPASSLKIDGGGKLRSGASADFVLFKGRTMGETLCRHQGDRVVVRAGRRINTAPPDYRDLDDLYDG